MYARRTLLSSCGLGAALLLSNSASAYNHTGHQLISDLSWQVMVASTKPEAIESTFSTQSAPSLDEAPAGANAEDWVTFLADVRSATSRIPKAHSGVDQAAAPPSACGGSSASEFLYPASNTRDCRSSELNLAPTTLWADDTSSCQARPLHNPGGIYTAVNAGFTGMHLGRLATAPDDQDHDTGLFWRPTDILGLGYVGNVVNETTNFAVAVLVAPFLCAINIFSGKSCWDGIEEGIEIGNDTDVVQRLTGNIGFFHTDQLMGRDLIGFWHFLQVDGGGGEFNDVAGLHYDFAGPGAESKGVVDTAMSLIGDLSGLSLEVDHSDGVRRYELVDSETNTPNPSERREVYEWQGRTFNHIEMNPLDNLAQHGMDEFEKDPSMLEPLSYPLHALGDVTVPMHVVGTSSWGHGPFEATVDDLFPQILFQHTDVQQQATDEERSEQLAQARRILLDGFRWWQWLRDFRADNPEWGQMPIRPFMLEIAKETRRNGDELLIDGASFIDVMQNIASAVVSIDPEVADAFEKATTDANASIAAYNTRTGAALAPVVHTPFSMGNVYHSLLPIIRERVEASAGAQVAFLTIVGSELIEPLPDDATTACAGIQPRCAAGQSAADGSCLDAAALCPEGTIPNPNIEGACMDENPTCTPGQHLNQTTRLCEYCAIDQTVTWNEVNCTGATSIPLEATSAPDDNCPNEFWVSLDNVKLATGATLFEATVTGFGDEATCTTIASNVDLYARKTDTTYEHLGNTSGFGEWNGTTCITPPGLQVPRDAVVGPTEVRVRALLFPDPGGATLRIGAIDGNTCEREIQ